MGKVRHDSGSGDEFAIDKTFHKGPWTSAEDQLLIAYVDKHGDGNWNAVQKHSGLSRCGKSCRLRWVNHLRPDLKKGSFTDKEEQRVIELHASMGNKWARMATELPGRTDNEIKNFWNTRVKRLQRLGLPIYPDEVREQAMNAAAQNGHNADSFDGHHSQESLELDCLEIPDFNFKHLQLNGGSSFLQTLLSSIPTGNQMRQNPSLFQPNIYNVIASPYQQPPNRKRFREPETAGRERERERDPENMAWLARSIANSLKIDEEEEDEKETIEDPGSDKPSSPSALKSQSPRGVKEDISELTKTFRSQLWGVASFLAPPPSSSDPTDEETRKSSDLAEGDEDLMAGMRSDFVEIGGRFKTGISKLSGNLPVSEITKMASSFWQGGDSEERDGVGDVIGVTEEVVGFARDLALHPETWLDFPFPEEDNNFDDFEMTDAQYEHALAVERVATGLAVLRIELCPAYMSEYCFWRIYFVLMHPKFSKHDALLLSTPQVLESRALLSHELLHKRNKAAVVLPETSGDTGTANANEEPLTVSSSEPVKTISVETIHSSETSEVETEKHPIENKPVTGSSPRVVQVDDDDDDDDVDDWLKDEDNAGTVSSTVATKHVVDEDEDVTFSDLEEDDDDVPVNYKK